MLAALFFAGSCGSSAKEQPPEVTPAAAPGTQDKAPAPAAPTATDSAKEDAEFFRDLPPATQKEAELSGLAAIRDRVVRGDRSPRTFKEVQKLSYLHPKNAEVAYMLGQLYCSKLWMNDGLEAFRKALKIEPILRSNPFLIRAAVAGLGNDGDHMKVRRFLVQEIGKPAAPFLEELLAGNYRQQVKDRATTILGEIK